MNKANEEDIIGNTANQDRDEVELRNYLDDWKPVKRYRKLTQIFLILSINLI